MGRRRRIDFGGRQAGTAGARRGDPGAARGGPQQAIFPEKEFVDAGGLMAYGANLSPELAVAVRGGLMVLSRRKNS